MRKTIILILICFLSAIPSFGATIWSIAGGLWSTTSSTGPDCSCTPAASDDIIVDDAGASITGLGDLTGTIDVLNGGDLTIDGLTMITPSSLTIRSGGTLNVTVDLKPKETAFVLVENGGTLNVGNRVEITNDAIMVIEGTVNVDGDKMVLKNNASLIIHSTGVLTMTDPTSVLDINSTGTLIVDGILGTPEEFKLNNSTMGGSGQISHGGTCSAGSGTINGEDQSVFCDAGLGGSIPMGSFYDTFYSFADGDWDDNNSWTFTSDGSSGAVGAGVWPGRYDNVIIRNGHTITIDAVDDNNFPGISPDDLYKSNVGTFTSSGVSMFYHSSDIIVDAGGTLSVTTIRSMYEGFLYVNGTFNSTQDVVNLGNLEVTSTATFNTDDDLVLSGNSFTVLDNTTTGDDDLYLDHTDALLCGSGTLNIGNGGADPTIQYLNSATEAQICSSFTITCTSNCGGFSPPTTGGSFISGYLGPGGVGDLQNLGLWLKADDLTGSDGSTVPAWTDASGNGNDAAQGTAGREPLFYNTSSLNSMPIVRFDGTNDEMTVADADILDNSSGLTFFSAIRPANLNGSPRGILGKRLNSGTPAGYSYTWFFFTTNYLNVDIDTQNDRFSTNPTTYSNATNYILSLIYDGSLAAGLRAKVYEEETNVVTASETSTSIPNGGTALTLGALNASYGTYLGADYGEIIQYNAAVNTTQRILINNYLSAKYNIGLSANNVYEQDGAGDFDFEVAGIGQASDGTFHKDAKGHGLVRVSLPGDLDNNEFLMWGHDGTAISAVNTTDVDGTIIEARLDRVWRVSENDDTGTAVDVGAVRLTFDVGSAPPGIVGSDLRLLITRDDASFADNDVSPQTGSYNIDDQLITFSNVLLEDGDRFTLGTVDNTSSPLPIELVTFSARPNSEGQIILKWVTASEENNDFFNIERSLKAIEWEKLTTLNGQGSTSSITNYSFLDETPFSGISYYRLKQTDFDGLFSYSSVISVNIDEDVFPSIELYPNPLSEVLFHIASNIGNEDKTNVAIWDVYGNKMSELVAYRNFDSNQNTFVYDATLGRPLKSGLYLVAVLINEMVVWDRLVIK